MVSLPVRTTWIVTGNNLEFSREIARRTVCIRLDARAAAPHLRTGFRHDPLRGWIRRNRGDLIRSVLILIQHWLAQGSPRFTTRRLGSYESYGEVVGGVLEAAGIQDFLANARAVLARDGEAIAWRRFAEVWWSRHHSQPVEVGTLFSLAEEVLKE